ncbi:MAG: lipoprotein [Candidatus Competibacteraceae bacterium]|nr:lipoprotein [Candidatus Competibacteraceae bacterium]
MKLSHRKRLQLPVLLLIFGILTGCGQKGDLYLPTEQPETQNQSEDQPDNQPEDQSEAQAEEPDPENPE